MAKLHKQVSLSGYKPETSFLDFEKAKGEFFAMYDKTNDLIQKIE